MGGNNDNAVYYKFIQVHETANIFSGVHNGTVFFDVCGGPGAFSQLLLQKAPSPVSGYGMTLIEDDSSIAWYKYLHNEKRWKALAGVDGTGNIYSKANVLHAAGEIHKNHPDGVDVVVADGGFHISSDAAGVHMENYQELFSARLILSELVVALNTLKNGGNFVCKLFDTVICKYCLPITLSVFAFHGLRIVCFSHIVYKCAHC